MLRSQRGQIAVLAYFAIAVFTVLGGSLLTQSFSSQQHSQRQQLQDEVFYCAEGGIEDAIARFSQAIANNDIAADAPRYPAAGTLATTLASGAIAAWWVAEAEPAPRAFVDPDGVSGSVKNYHVTVTVTHPDFPGATFPAVHQVIARRVMSAFQHAVFYVGDLEWLPGPEMTLSGRVYSNGDIYLGAGDLLTVDSEYLRAAGDLYNHRKDSNGGMPGIVQIKKAGTSPAEYVAMDGFDSDDPTWAAESQTRWNGTVQTGVHGVATLSAPVVGSITPGGYYDNAAELRIENERVTLNGVDVPLADLPPGTIRTTTSLYNARERKSIKMTEVDLKRLAGYHDGDGDGVLDPPGSPGNPYTSKLPANGLVYATRSDAPVSEQPGIRLVNGSEIQRAGGLTLVSNDPVYVQGNFNTVGKKPVAIIGDALNLLSNNWDDGVGNAGTATTTTYNAAFIAGINPTEAGNYSGGLENYPRFHERWSGVTCNITGSFVSLWESQIATGDWINQRYSPPIRNWTYDTSFVSGTAMPPFTPSTVETVRGAWWQD